MAGVAGRSGGRNAKTVRQHTLEGTTRVARHSGYANAEPPMGDPPMPDGLDAVAAAEWTRMVERLRKSQTLAVTDDGALFQYCCLFSETEASAARQVVNEARVERLESALGELSGGDLVEAMRAIAMLTRAIGRGEPHIRQCRMAIRAYLVEFGQTPAARSRVRVPEKSAEPDPFDAFDKPFH